MHLVIRFRGEDVLEIATGRDVEPLDQAEDEAEPAEAERKAEQAPRIPAVYGHALGADLSVGGRSFGFIPHDEPPEPELRRDRRA